MIVPMKKATLVALKDDREKLLKSLQKSGEFMVIEPSAEGEGTAGSGETADVKTQEVGTTLKLMNRYHKDGFLAARPVVDYQTFDEHNERGEELVAQTNALTNAIAGNQAEIAMLENQNASLAPWLTLDTPLEDLVGTKAVDLTTGFIHPNIEQEAKAAIAEHDGELQELGLAPEGCAVIIMSYQDDTPGLRQALKDLGFSETAPPRLMGLPQDIKAANEEKIAASKAKIEELEGELEKLSAGKEEVALLKDQYESERARRSVKSEETVETFILSGWVRSDRIDVVEKAVTSVTDTYDLAYADPEEGEQPPTATKNSHFLSQFETITDMFALPEPGTIDPTPISGPWYWLIFGLMMGDVGYGLCMLILFGAFLKLKKPKGDFGKLVRVLFYSSFTTIICGFLFGSYFGAEWFPPILFVPLDDPITMMIICLVLGVVHMFCGMGIGIVEQVRAGKVWDAIFDRVSWMVLLTGLGFLFLPQLAGLGKWMAIGGAIVIFLTAGRDKPNIVGKVTGGLLGLYDISGYVSDILSYSRILALSLATAVIAFVMNLLAGMVSGSAIGFVFAILIYLVGHTFNLVMSLLSAYVHDSRLQYIEFFGKFYDGGGYAFKPLALKNDHVDIAEADASAQN